MLALCSPARAQPTDGPGASDPMGLFDWEAPPVPAQLATDPTVVPPDRGALFVPRLTSPDSEPEVVVLDDGQRVASGPTGRRIVLPPGRYRVRVGSGALNQTLAIPVEVRAAETTVVPVEWGGLVIEVVDENNIPFRGDYEIIRAVDRELYGIGFGADTLQGEPLRSWLLPPGLYRIVRPGDSYRTRTDFATVYVVPGGLLHFKLVVDPDTGAFRGAGLVPASELSRPQIEALWSGQIVLGLNLGLTHSQNVAGADDELVLAGELFADLLATFDDGRNFFTTILEVEEGAEGEPTPFEVAGDRVRLDIAYTYFLHPRVGPYVRFQGIAAVFPSTITLDEDTTVRRIFPDGTMDEVFVAAGEMFRTGEWLSSLQLREGAGVNFRLVRLDWANANLRLGTGFRQNLFRRLFVEDDDDATEALEYRLVQDFNQEGIELVFDGDVRLARFITFVTELDLFSDFQQFADPDLSWLNTLSFRFASFVALDYTVDLTRELQVTDELQITQDVLLRFSWEPL